jgi:predicted nuclease of restriction endonuclease-like RecB superfamily
MKKKPPNGYDSWFEHDLHKQQLRACKFHPCKLSYVQKKLYEPDFVYHDGKIVIYIEVKGRFRTSGEARKYVDVAANLKKNEILVFIFSDPDKPMPNAQRRKDGTRRTHGEWAKSYNFQHYTRETTPHMWSIK